MRRLALPALCDRDVLLDCWRRYMRLVATGRA